MAAVSLCRATGDAGLSLILVQPHAFRWGELMARALLAGVPVAIPCNLLLDYVVEGITGGALRN